MLMKRNLILSGGPAHDFARTSPMLAELLRAVDIESEIHESFAAIEDGSLLEFDLLTINCIRWTCSQPQVSAEWRENWALTLSAAARDGFLRFLDAGRGLLALHGATICFDDWPEYRQILGAWWDWGHSGHAPFQKHAMRVHTDFHPVTAGVEDFVVEDELYTDARITDSVSPLVEGEWQGALHPMLWLREYGQARVCYNALGHGPEAFEHPANRVLLQRGALWALECLTEEAHAT